MWKYYALLSAFFAALTAVLVKAGVNRIDSNLATAIRTGVVLVIAWGIVFATGIGEKFRAITAHNWLFLILSGVATALSWLFYFKAIQCGELSKVAPVEKLGIVFTILLGLIIFREPVSFGMAAGALLVVGGVALIAFS